MSQTNSGEQESSEEPKVSAAELEVKKLDSFLDGYMMKIGLGNISESDVSKYFNLNEAKLKAMSAEDCSMGAYLLIQEALYVQGEINKYQAQLDFAKSKMKRAVAPKISEYGGKFSTNETRELLAIKDNSYASEFLVIANKCERIIARLQYVPTQLRAMAEMLDRYQNYKMRTGNETARLNQESRSN